MSFPQGPTPAAPPEDEFFSTTSVEGASTIEGSSYRTARYLYVWDKWTADWVEEPLPPIDPPD